MLELVMIKVFYMSQVLVLKSTSDGETRLHPQKGHMANKTLVNPANICFLRKISAGTQDVWCRYCNLQISALKYKQPLLPLFFLKLKTF